MARIRIGVRPWDGAGEVWPDEASSSRNIVWVEIDGCRIDGHIVSVQGKWGEGHHVTTLEVIGVPEFVLLAPDREPLEGPLSDERAEALLQAGIKRIHDDERLDAEIAKAEMAVEKLRVQKETAVANRQESWQRFKEKVDSLRG